MARVSVTSRWSWGPRPSGRRQAAVAEPPVPAAAAELGGRVQRRRGRERVVLDRPCPVPAGPTLRHVLTTALRGLRGAVVRPRPVVDAERTRFVRTGERVTDDRALALARARPHFVLLDRHPDHPHVAGFGNRRPFLEDRRRRLLPCAELVSSLVPGRPEVVGAKAHHAASR